MTPDQDCFQRAARRFLAENGSVAAAGQVSEDENKDKAGAVIELEPIGLGGDRLREAVDLLEVVESGEDVVEHVQEVPEKVIATIQVDGQPCEVEIVEHDNGSVRDVATGRFLAPPSPNTFEDPKKAREAVTKRHARATEEARMGLVRGVVRKGHDVEAPEEAWGIVVEEQAVAALSDKRGATGAARFVGQVTGLAGEDKEQPRVSVPGGVVVVTDFETILLAMFNKLYPGDPVTALREMKEYRNGLKR